MNDDTMLPKDDRDRSLARRLGALLEQGSSLEEAAGDDPAEASFYRALLAFRQAQAEETMPSDDASRRAWARLEQAIAQARPASAPAWGLRLLRPAWRGMAVAASVLLMAALGWLLFLRPPASVLLAAADADIVTYTASDGSVVTLRPHSQLYAVRSGEAETRVRLVGEGFFDVAKNEARVFSVEANDALVSVLGTRFDVSTWGRQTAVYLETGRVRFAHLPTEEAVVLAPGQRSIVTAEGTLLAPTDADNSEYLDWLRREITFSQRPLHRVLDELAHHFNVTIEAPDAWQDETVTGRVLLDQLERTLDDLAVILGGRFVKVNEDTYRFVAGPTGASPGVGPPRALAGAAAGA